MTPLNIAFVQAGGTIDKKYPAGSGNHGYGFHIGTPAFVRILRRTMLVPTQTISACRKDSLDINDMDLVIIATGVLQTESKHVIVTCGTDRIKDIAKFLAQHSDISTSDLTIVLTGAMQPENVRGFDEEINQPVDADFNLGMAVGVIPHLETGVYIALNGKVVPWEAYIAD